jgi:acetoin utilization deacetylase AcuC-like enzyme
MAAPSPAPLWLRHDSSFGHVIPGHPERPERIKALEAVLSRQDWFGWNVAEAPAVEREQLRQVHPESHVAFIEEVCAGGGGQIDLDTAAVADTWETIVHAAGGAVALVDALVSGEATAGFSGLRPPGHHAERERAMGFCFFNSAAVAARHATIVHGLERVMILDWDVHHGNGTNDIFHDDEDVLYMSIHQWPLYPGTGPPSDVGSRAGEGFTVNVPVPGGTGDDAYRSLVEHVACTLVRAWEPQLVLVSAGFDAHRADPLAGCQVTEAGYAGMTASLRRACDEVGAPVGAVLEGGYAVEALAASVAALLPVLGGYAGSSVDAEDVRVHPLAADAARRLERYWPSLAGAVG